MTPYNLILVCDFHAAIYIYISYIRIVVFFSEEPFVSNDRARIVLSLHCTDDLNIVVKCDNRTDRE